MIRRAKHLFRRYCTQHASHIRKGFPLLDIDGEKFGNIDHITLRRGRLIVEGWAKTDKVGLIAARQAIALTPDMVREDVVRAHPENLSASGFILDLPVLADYVAFWAQRDGGRNFYTLPQLTADDMRAIRRRQVLPFIRDGIRALPAVLRWFLRRDPRSVSQVLTIMGLNAVVSAGLMNDLLFAEDAETTSTPPEALHRTGISIVLPVYNAFDLLPEVLDRVLRHTDLPWRLILVEDCSSDNQVRPWLRKWHAGLNDDIRQQVILIENDRNLGFVRSVNRAFEVALPHDDHVVLLNSDAFVPEGWASRLIRPLLEHDDVATVTPMSNDAEIFSVPAICRRDVLKPGEAEAIDRVAQRFYSGVDVADAPTGVGFCMAMHVDYLKKLPAFDTAFGRGYGEEVDWCQRALQLGGRHLGLAGLFVEHRGGTSFGSEEKLRQIRKASDIITHRYPDYDRDVQDFILGDPLLTPRLALALAWAAERQKGAVPIYLAHSMGGGAEHYLQRRIAADLKRESAAVVLRVGGELRWQIEIHTAHGVSRGQTDKTAFIERLVGLLPKRQVIYSCGAGDDNPLEIPQLLMSLASGPEDGVEVLIHDYLSLSPSFNLLGEDGIYRGLPDADTNTDPAHEFHGSYGTKTSLAEWRATWGKLMRRADQILVFSEDSQRLVSEAYPEVAGRIVLKPHTLHTAVPRLKPGNGQDGLPVIGVLGNIGFEKGAAVLRDLSAALAQSGAARLVVLGNVDSKYKLAAPAQIHGEYRIDEIAGLVQRYGISQWLIPSICPETFSYTTHEVLATGLPVWSFDLGAQGSAVAAAAATNGHGGVIELPETGHDITIILDRMLQTSALSDLSDGSEACPKDRLAAVDG